MEKINIKINRKENTLHFVLEDSFFVIRLDSIVEMIYGNFTSNFKIYPDKQSILPWKCMSLIDNYYQAYDFIFKFEEDAFIFWIAVYLIQHKLTENSSNIVKKLLYKFLWLKTFMKVRYHLSANKI